MQPIRVLSIDWDYFIDASNDFRMSHFPDGGTENLPAKMLDLVWISRYGYKGLEQVKVDTSELLKLRELLRKIIKPYTKVVIADSHKDIYKYVENLSKSNLSMELYNIDFHHDVYDFGNENVDCGNWLRKCIEKQGTDQNKFVWVRREDSQLSGLELIDNSSVVGISEDLSGGFQLVFLCRSSAWSPPHLDDKFLSLCRFIGKLSCNVKVTEPRGVLANRYNNQFKTNVKVHRKFMANMEAHINNNQKEEV